uniref:MULE transposase domain-containing protein n=1 Tax=Cacopsylla melanoneura TaxID=428564 RepID=A0A8D9B618_9HEMI
MKFDLMPEAPDTHKVTAFADYFVDTYIIALESLFPPSLWAEDTASLTRTTNACESFHAHLKRVFYSPHPSIFIFIEELKGIQMETVIKCNGMNEGRKRIYSSKSRKKKKKKKK